MKFVDYLLAAVVFHLLMVFLIVMAGSTVKKGIIIWKCSDMIMYENHLEVSVPEVCLEMYGEDREG